MTGGGGFEVTVHVFLDVRFYRAMHFSAKRGIAIACRLSVCLPVTLVDCDHIGWNTSEIISPLVSVGCSLSADPNIIGLLQGNTPTHLNKLGSPGLVAYPATLLSLMVSDRVEL